MSARHSRESGNPVLTSSSKSLLKAWIPAFAGITLLFSVPYNSFAVENVTIRTTDGAELKALFSKPATGKPVVIMHHGLASGKEEWLPLIDALTKKGVGVLAYDARPAGTPWQKLVDDVGAAVRFLETKQGIDRKSVVLAGASLGANVCLKYNALTQVGRRVLLLSPGLNYQGLEIEDVVAKSKTPILFVAHPADGYAYQSCRRLAPLASRGEFWTSTKAGHGVQMFEGSLLDKLAQWLEKKN